MTRTAMIHRFVDGGAREANLSVAAFVAWSVIFRHAADGRLRVTVDQIMRSAGMSRPTAVKALSELKSKGFLRLSGGGKRSNRYRLSPISTQAEGQSNVSPVTHYPGN
jgi:CRP-like cAMP-binding protein